jgi:hypothetical protein
LLDELNSNTNFTFLRDCKNIEVLSLWGKYNEKIQSTDIIHHIQHLDLSSLSIGNFAKLETENFKFFSGLKKLSLTNCMLKDISFLHQLTQLEDLNLTFNDISNLQPLSKLIRLSSLDRSNNQIADISPFENLKQLKSITLTNNPITDLRPLLDLNLRFVIYDETWRYAEEGEIVITGCDQITNPPMDIVKQGDEAIRSYFTKIEKEGYENIYEAKLILVGEGGAGKTSLQKRLKDENAILPKEEERTRGIEVVDLEFEKGKIAHIWDFGGQDVYYPVHRFFITENTVFVLLASTRHNSHNFDYWLPTIFQFGGKSPIIIGQTCHEGLSTKWSEVNRYLGNDNFKIIRTLEEPYYRINLKHETIKNEGLDTIRGIIISQISCLHHFGKPVPKSWAKVRKALYDRSKSDAYISFESFAEIYRSFAPVSFHSRKDIEDCCRFLHNIGVILWYSEIEELSDNVILRPNWAMNAVYKIIDDKVIQDNKGKINPADFKRLWGDKTYQGKQAVLKKMLETFKIAFPTKHLQGHYIIPAHLPCLPPEKRWVLDENYLRLDYIFEFMPKGIVNQLSAELSRYIKGDEVWSDAVNINLEELEAQVIEETYHRKLTITAKGKARGMNMLIMDALKNIMDSYKGVKAEINVQCPCKECQQAATPSTFAYSQLVEKLHKKRDSVTCNRSDEVFSISELLYNVGFEKTGTQQAIKKIYIFLASSAELKDDREQFKLFIYDENKVWIDKGIFIELVIWEDFIDCMSPTRLQDEYNKAAIGSDIFVSLFWTKAGKYTSEEFNESYANFIKRGKPVIYTYFKKTGVDLTVTKRNDVNSLFDFKEKLERLGHYPTDYSSIDDLKYQFKMQLQKKLLQLCKS